jgi:hypothetical protein
MMRRIRFSTVMVTRFLTTVGTCAIAVVSVAGCVAPTKAPLATVTVTAPPGITAPTTSAGNSPTPNAGTIPGNGTFRVGADVQPGTYSTAGPANGSPFCSWWRLSDLSGTDSTPIAMNNEPGQAFVTIQPTDVAFKSQFCQPWKKVG